MPLTLTIDDDKLSIDIEPDSNTIEIWNNDHWNIIILSDAQLKEVKEYLNREQI